MSPILTDEEQQELVQLLRKVESKLSTVRAKFLAADESLRNLEAGIKNVEGRTLWTWNKANRQYELESDVSAECDVLSRDDVHCWRMIDEARGALRFAISALEDLHSGGRCGTE